MEEQGATSYATLTVCQPLTHFISFTPHRSPYAHFSGVETEAQRSKVAYLESHSQKVEVQGSGPTTQACVHRAWLKADSKTEKAAHQRPQCVLLCPPRGCRGSLGSLAAGERPGPCPSPCPCSRRHCSSVPSSSTEWGRCLRSLFHSSPKAASTNAQGGPMRGTDCHPRLVLRS